MYGSYAWRGSSRGGNGGDSAPNDLSNDAREVMTSATLSDLYEVPVEVLHASDGRLVVVGQPEAPAHHHDRHALGPGEHGHGG